MFMRKYIPYIGLVLSLIFLLISCDGLIPSGPADDELLDGPVDGLSSEEIVRFNPELIYPLCSLVQL